MVVVSVAILDLLWNVAGGNPVEEQIRALSEQVERLSHTVDVIENAKQVGLHSVTSCTGDFGGKSEWFELMESASGSMDLMGRTLHEWIRAPELDEILNRKICSDNVSFRWLLMSPRNPHLTQLEEAGELIGESLGRKLDLVAKRLTEIRAGLPEDRRNQLQVRLFSDVPLYCSTLRIDDHFVVTPYLQSVASRNSPMIRLQGGTTAWARSYNREFEMVWDAADDLFSENLPGAV